MIRINLLPHREEKRRERRQQFYTLSGMMIALGAAIWLLVHIVNSAAIDSQDARNNIFETRIAALDKEISDIKTLREQIDRLVARKRVIETLQSNRAETVHLFNELPARVPTGVYLVSIQQTNDKITLKGFAQSNARVSYLMSSLDASPFLERPELKESKAQELNGRRAYSFEVNFYIEHSAPDNEQAADAAAPQAQKG